MNTKILYFLIAVSTFLLKPTFCLAQNGCDGGGSQTGGLGSGGDGGPSDSDDDDGSDGPDSTEVLFPHDPNLITGPRGFAFKQWMSYRDQLGYLVNFENDPKSATTAAQNVFIRINIDPKFNANTVRLSDFGFGNYSFKIPNNLSFYSDRLDVRDSLGLYVDVIAGVDIVNNQIFWNFRSIDPVTGQTPLDATKGFLPVNDTLKRDSVAGPGEGFVRFTIAPVDGVNTGDTISALASIVFDQNDSVPTNLWTNTLDALPPTSKINNYNLKGHDVKLSWNGQDDAGGSGIRDYSLYVKENAGVFTLFKEKIADTVFTYSAAPGSDYEFFILATDNTGNQETLKTKADIVVHTAACGTEVCNGVDDDCDGLVDEDFIHTYYRDTDGDGYGDNNVTITASECNHESGYVLKGDDCDDNDANIYPGAPEVCGNGKDDNCDGHIDEDCATSSTWYRDRDGDGYGDPSVSQTAVLQPSGYVANNTDCDDTNGSVHPGATEICDGLDNNCDGQIDEGLVKNTYYRDSDDDGYGAAGVSITVCGTTPPSGYVANNTDCNDLDATIYPGAPELCDGKDNDCNGLVDDGANLITYYRDADGDGYGNASLSITACSQPSGYVTNSTDCNDNDATTHTIVTYYRDADGDGYGRLDQTISSCSLNPPAGYVTNSTDCNDNDATVYLGAPELCDGKDNNCNGSIDEGLQQRIWYRDADGDGYGTNSVTTIACQQPAGYVNNNNDCDDTNANVHPGATEICDGIDNDCDGKIDDKCISNVLPQITVSDATVYENAGVAAVTVSLNKAFTQTITVRYSTANGSAVHPKDYERVNGTLTFSQGVTSQTISIVIKADNIIEGAESFMINLSNAGNAAIVDDAGTITILDPIVTTTKIDKQPREANENVTTSFEITAHPNPSNTYFNLEIKGKTNTVVSLRITDGLGRVIESRANIFVNSSIKLGERYRTGLYFVEVSQGGQRKILKLLKQ